MELYHKRFIDTLPIYEYKTITKPSLNYHTCTVKYHADNKIFGYGYGCSKKRARNFAAKHLLFKLEI